MKELEYINLNYKPKKDLICLFRVEAVKKIGLRKAAEHIAGESSIGTWTKIPKTKKKLAAKVFYINEKKKLIKIAYPAKLFEAENAAGILSGIAGNIFGMKSIKNLRLEDVSFPKKILKVYSGPRYGIKGIRKLLKIKSRPLIGTIIKPKLGLSPKEHAKCAYEAWIGGCDIVKDDENLVNQNFNNFKERVVLTLKAKEIAEKETGEKKAYLPNVTAESGEMIKRAKFVEEVNGNYVMLDILTAGFSALQTLRKNTKLPIHAHRAMHAAITRNKKHGISMMVFADFARLIGVDTLHIGTGIGKMEGGIKEIKQIKDEIEKQEVADTVLRLKQKWYKIKPVLAVASGGLYPGHVPFLVENLGKDIVIQAGGGVHGHVSGTLAGARAMRQAVNAVIQGISLKKYAKNHKELREALKQWKV